MAKGPREACAGTSCLVAIAFEEPGSAKAATRLAASEPVFAPGLLEAALKAALRREGVQGDAGDVLPDLGWISPDRPLSGEIDSGQG